MTARVCWLGVGRVLACLLALAMMLPAGGCSAKTTTKKSKSAAADVPAIDPSTAFAVDEGRIAVSSPTGWTRLPRQKDCLVKYQPGPKKSYPKVLVTAAPAPEGLGEITEENHKEFASGIAAGVKQALGDASPLQKPAAVKIGDHLGVAWGIPGTIKTDGMQETIERWSYAVVIGGRMYTVEARAPKGKIDATAKGVAKAMAAALAPPSATAASAPAAADGEANPAGEASPLDALGSLTAEEEKPAEAKPAEEKPAEEKPTEEKPAGDADK
jgi:hypothetical protein